jgi:DNA invertase Pin-like site-specific DNA recombinase
MKRCALYLRVSTVDQHPETQLYDLRGLAAQRNLEIVHEYTDKISGAKAKRPGLDQLLADARRGKFDVILVWACDRIARSTRHFLEVLDELNHLGIEFVTFRENIDTGGPLGRAIVVIIGAIAELERNLIIERVRAGMRRARLEGRQIGGLRAVSKTVGLDHRGLLSRRRWSTAETCIASFCRHQLAVSGCILTMQHRANSLSHLQDVFLARDQLVKNGVYEKAKQ